MPDFPEEDQPPSERPTRAPSDGKVDLRDGLRAAISQPPPRGSTFPPRASSIPPMPKVLFLDTPYVMLSLDGPIVHFLRTSIPYPDVETLTENLDAIAAALEKVRARPRGLLIDMREVVGRNDSAFEATLAPRRRRIVQSFDAVAFVMATHVGRLQSKRHASKDGVHSQIFPDSTAGVHWLKQELSLRREPGQSRGSK